MQELKKVTKGWLRPSGESKARYVDRDVDCPFWKQFLYRQFLLRVLLLKRQPTCWRQWHFAIG